MADLLAASTESIVSVCTENVAAIAESLNQCFDVQHTLTIGEPAAWDADTPPEGLDEPGLLVTCRVGPHAVICAIPARLPLPAWYTDPGDSERARLDTLAMEWSMNLLPADLESDQFTSYAFPNLLETLKQVEPTEGAQVLPLAVAGKDEESTATLWLMWPIAKPPSDPTPQESADTIQAASPETTSGHSMAAQTGPTAGAPASVGVNAAKMARLLQLPVPVIVKLAEKRIELQELLTISSGSIISFNQPCENLLELLVNNQPYALGEAVKIGEKFGLKIAEIGVTPIQEERIIL